MKERLTNAVEHKDNSVFALMGGIAAAGALAAATGYLAPAVAAKYVIGGSMASAAYAAFK